MKIVLSDEQSAAVCIAAAKMNITAAAFVDRAIGDLLRVCRPRAGAAALEIFAQQSVTLAEARMPNDNFTLLQLVQHFDWWADLDAKDRRQLGIRFKKALTNSGFAVQVARRSNNLTVYARTVQSSPCTRVSYSGIARSSARSPLQTSVPS